MMSFSHDMKKYIYDKDDGQVKKKEEKKAAILGQRST